MPDIVEIEDRFYIHVDSALTDRRTLVLKEDDAFGVFSTTGDVETIVDNTHGLYRDDTRFLSRLELRLEGRRPLLLGSAVTRDNARIHADYTNPDLLPGRDRIALPRGTLHLSRSRFLWHGTMYERITIANFGFGAVQAHLSIAFGADFADIFEIRGTRRAARGDYLAPEVSGAAVTLAYKGRDDRTRRAVLRFHPAPKELTRRDARFVLQLEPRRRAAIQFTAACETDAPTPPRGFAAARASLMGHIESFHDGQCTIESSNEHMADWTGRSLADIRALLARTHSGVYPHAGVPWYSAPFGRDGIITALEMLWINPAVARGVLGYLAATQADAHEPPRDAEPGKILHERRVNEMAATGEVPFSRYYGTIDATPLFVVLAGEYFRCTGDRPFIESLWTNITRAMDWLDAALAEGDGLVAYKAKTDQGLVNQGWKDSHDSISHADGSLAHGPIALCEVQGYAYHACLSASMLARTLDIRDDADRYAATARRILARFTGSFWLPHLGTFALALDGECRACAVRTSNAGHCLYSGIASPDQARRLARVLMSPQMFTGWGIRTLATSEARYDPMSYHNGSVWPHDNAIIAAGLARYGQRTAARRLMESWFDASIYLDLHRLPELFCGFPRRHGHGPTPYPVACSPQAWAAGAVFMLLQACLGLSLDGPRGRVRIRRPRLPSSIRRLRIRGLRIADSAVDLLFHSDGGDVGVLLLGKDGPARVDVLK